MATQAEREWIFGTSREPVIEIAREIVKRDKIGLLHTRCPSPLERRRPRTKVRPSDLFEGAFRSRHVNKNSKPKKVKEGVTEEVIMGKKYYHPHLQIVKARLALSPYLTKPQSDYSNETLNLMDVTKIPIPDPDAEEEEPPPRPVISLSEKEVLKSFKHVMTFNMSYAKEPPSTFPKDDPANYPHMSSLPSLLQPTTTTGTGAGGRSRSPPVPFLVSTKGTFNREDPKRLVKSDSPGTTRKPRRRPLTAGAARTDGTAFFCDQLTKSSVRLEAEYHAFADTHPWEESYGPELRGHINKLPVHPVHPKDMAESDNLQRTQHVQTQSKPNTSERPHSPSDLIFEDDDLTCEDGDFDAALSRDQLVDCLADLFDKKGSLRQRQSQRCVSAGLRGFTRPALDPVPLVRSSLPTGSRRPQSSSNYFLSKSKPSVVRARVDI